MSPGAGAGGGLPHSDVGVVLGIGTSVFFLILIGVIFGVGLTGVIIGIGT